jgi:hypothetical protein
MTWFEVLTGFSEESPSQVRAHLRVDGEGLTSLVNGRTFACGRLETPSLGELRERVRALSPRPGRLAVGEVVGEAAALHGDPANAGALFQVASQFNLLEMVSPSVTPEQGVGIYQRDPTQGPACAVAAGAGTIYRNYLVPVDGQLGQSAARQIDCLADLGAALGNGDGRLWRMRNGYALASLQGLEEISRRLSTASEGERDQLRQRLRIGVQWGTQVTRPDAGHRVTQVYASALPVAYSEQAPELWEPFARLILEAAYEATLCVARLNAQGTGNRRVYLTLLGGGAFGNRIEWIGTAIEGALRGVMEHDLEVFLVSYRESNPLARELVRRFASGPGASLGGSS